MWEQGCEQRQKVGKFWAFVEGDGAVGRVLWQGHMRDEGDRKGGLESWVLGSGLHGAKFSKFCGVKWGNHEGFPAGYGSIIEVDKFLGHLSRKPL